MVNSRHNGNGNEKREFFGAVTKNFRAFVAESKREVRDQIAKRGIAKHNFVLFLCWSDGNGKVREKAIMKPRFRVTRAHYRVLETACVNFLANEV